MEINLKVMWEVFLKRLWIIIISLVVAAAGAYACCEFLITPRYQATASILVTNGSLTTQRETDIRTSVSGTDISTSIQLVGTVIDILQTPEVYRETSKKSNGKFDYDEIYNTAKVERKSDNSLFINVSFSDSDTKRAIELTNLFSETACTYVANMIPYSKASVAAKAAKANYIFPKTFYAMAIAGILAAVLVFAIFYLFENNNKIIRNEEEFTKHFKIPIIGAVPDFEDEAGGSYYSSGSSGKKSKKSKKKKDKAKDSDSKNGETTEKGTK